MLDSKLLEFVIERTLISILDKMCISQLTLHQLQKVLRSIESHMLMNPAKSKSIGVLLRIPSISQMATVTERAPMHQLTFQM